MAFTREPRRFYPNRTLAATVMGHAGSEGSGLEGVELAFDSAAARHVVVGAGDAGRAGARHGRSTAPSMGPSTAGSDVVLTIDRYLTFITERALASAAAEHQRQGRRSRS